MAMRAAILILLLGLTAPGALAAREPRSVSDLAGLAPANSMVFAAYVPRSEGFDGAAWTKALGGEVRQRFEETEKWLGTTLVQIFTWAEPTGFAVLLPGAEPEADPEWAVALALKDEAAARRAVERFSGLHAEDLGLQARSQAGVSMWAPAEGRSGPSLAVDGGFLVVGSEAGVVGTVRSARGQATGLAGTPLFVRAMAKVPARRGGFVFVPARQALAGVEMANEFVDTLRSFDFVVSGEVRRGDRWVAESFLQLDPRATSPLAWALMIPPRPSPDLAGWFPSDVATYGSVDLETFYRPAMAVLRWSGPLMRSSPLVEPLDQLLRTLTGRLAFATDSLFQRGPDGEEVMPTVLVAAGVQDEKGLLAVAERLEQEAAAGQSQTPYVECQMNLKNIGTACEMYSTDWSGDYPRQLGQVTPDYLRTIPTCPAAGADTYSAGFRSAVSPPVFTVSCQGRHHESVGVGPDLPTYGSNMGLTAPEARPQTTTTARHSRPVDGAAVYSYADFPVAWTLRGQGEDRVLLFGFGPGAEGLLARSLQSRKGGGSVAGNALYRDMISDAEGTVVATAFVRGQALRDGLKEALADSEELQPLIPHVASDDMVGYMAMEEGGLRNVSSATMGVSVAPALAAVLVPNFVRARSHGQATACKSNLKNIGVALEMYCTDYHGRYPTSLGGLTPDYLRMIPTCPSARKDTYSEGFTSSVLPDTYTVFCQGENHAGAGIPANYPQYNWLEGLVER